MQSSTSPLLTLTEVSSMLRIPKNTIYYWVHLNEIPYLKIGRHLRFNEASVLDFFKDKTRDSRPACRPLTELLKDRPWYGEKPLHGSLKTEEGALPKLTKE